MVIRCVGCGGDITNAKGKRTLCSEASQHVESLWCQLFDKSYDVKEEMEMPMI